MKPFDLEAAKNGAPAQTRDGRPAKIVCFDFKSKHGTMVVAVTRPEFESLHIYYDNGRFSKNGILEEDLVMAPTKKDGYIVLFRDTNLDGKPNGNVLTTERIFPTREEAEKAFAGYEKWVVDIQHIEWEE